MYCINCGKKLDKDAEFCKYCGTAVPPVKQITRKKETTIDYEQEEEKGIKFSFRNLLSFKHQKSNFFKETTEALEKKEENLSKPKIFLNKFNPVQLAIIAFIMVYVGQALIFNRSVNYSDVINPMFGPIYNLTFFAKPVAQFLINIKSKINNVGLSLILFITGIIIFILANYASNKFYKKDNLPLKIEIITLTLIILLGTFFRLYNINEMPAGCFSDEAQNGNEAINIIKGNKIEGTTLPVYLERDSSHNPAYYIYILAVFIKFFGIGPTQIRVATAIFGILTIPLIYFLIRNIFGARTAIFAAFLFASLRWNVNFSRIAFHAAFAVFIMTLAIYFLWRIYKNRKWSDFVLFGITTALTQYTYLPARFYIAILLIFFIYVLIKDFSFYKNNLRKLTLAVMVGFIVFLPLLTFIVQYPKKFWTSRQETLILNPQKVKDFYHGQYKDVQDVLLNNIKVTMLMFNNLGDPNARHNYPQYPMLDFMTGILAILGFGLALFNIHKLWALISISGFFIFMLGGFLTIEAPQSLRTILIIPYIFIFISSVINKFLQFAEQNRNEKIIWAFLILILLFATLENYDIYFNMQAKNPKCYYEFRTDEAFAAQFLKELGPNWHAIMMPHYHYSYVCKYILADLNIISRDSTGRDTSRILTTEPFEPALSIPIDLSKYEEKEKKKNFVYILQKEYEPIVPLLKDIYPQGQYLPFYNKYDKNQMLFFAYKILSEDVIKISNKKLKNGLRGRYYYGLNWGGGPAIDRIDPFILFNWTVDPLPQKFSVKWTGKIKIENPGLYIFKTYSNDFSDLYINGKKILENQGLKTGGWAVGKIDLTAGIHNIQVRYYESINFSKVELWWQKPGEKDPAVVPYNVLFPE